MKRIILTAALLVPIAAHAQEPPAITLTPQEAQQIINALAPPAMQMLIGKLQAAQRDAATPIRQGAAAVAAAANPHATPEAGKK